MIHVLFEAALRPGELLSMRISSVEFKRDYCIITVNGKTGIKRIPLVASLMPLLEWVRAHPNRDDPNAPLWISLAQNYYGHPLSYRHFRLTIRRLAMKAGVKKDVWPYLFRHTTLTRMAKNLTEANLEKFAGWVHGSRMSARYVHFSARDIEDAILAIYGIGKIEGNGMPIKIVKCPRCGGHNPEHHRFCSQCGLPLSMKDTYKAEMSAKEVVETAEKMEALEWYAAKICLAAEQQHLLNGKDPKCVAETAIHIADERMGSFLGRAYLQAFGIRYSGDVARVLASLPVKWSESPVVVQFILASLGREKYREMRLRFGMKGD